MTKENLLDKLDEAQTPEEIKALGQELLALDPNDPHGKLAVWEGMDNDEALDNLDMLREALDVARAVVEAKTEPPSLEDDRDAMAYATILMNLGFSVLAAGETEQAYEFAKELTNFDDEGIYPGRTLLYRCMLDLGLYAEILDTLEADPLESVLGEHARAIALLEQGADKLEVFDAVNYAMSISPDVPFYVLGMWDFPESEDDLDEDEADAISDAMYLYEPWSKTDERLAALSAPTFLFGYITDRIDDKKEMQVLKEGYEEYGVLDKVEAAKKEIEKMEKKGCEIEEIDATAIGFTGDILEELGKAAEAE
ncbi:MAG: hypothetical protein RR091_03370 [Cloacibacillus sp.]